MAEDHRRVLPRGIVGTGMAVDPERVRDIEDEAGRFERSFREPPAQSFGEVLETAPAKEQELVDEEAPAKKTKRSPDDEKKTRPIDPRARALHALMDKNKNKP